MLNEPLAEKIALSALAHAARAPLAAQCRRGCAHRTAHRGLAAVMLEITEAAEEACLGAEGERKFLRFWRFS